AVRVFLAGRLRCAQAAASSAELRAARSPTRRSLRVADWSGGRTGLAEETGALPPLAVDRVSAPVRPFDWISGSDRGGPERSFGRTLRSGASRSSSPAIPTNVNSA